MGDNMSTALCINAVFDFDGFSLIRGRVQDAKCRVISVEQRESKESKGLL